MRLLEIIPSSSEASEGPQLHKHLVVVAQRVMPITNNSSHSVWRPVVTPAFHTPEHIWFPINPLGMWYYDSISQPRKLRLSKELSSPGQGSNSSLCDPRVSHLHAVFDRATIAFLEPFLVLRVHPDVLTGISHMDWGVSGAFPGRHWSQLHGRENRLCEHQGHSWQKDCHSHS